MFLRKIFLRFKRRLFYKRFGFCPEDMKRLIYIQKYLDKIHRKDKKYNEYIKSNFI